MHRLHFLVPLIILGLISCATLTSKSRMERFQRISEAYEFDLLDSDWRGAAGFIHASVKDKSLDEKKYRNIKIVEYIVTRVNVSPDQLKIDQDIELKYFLLNSNRLRTTRHQQQWRYDEAGRVWMLYSGLPDFKQ